MVLNDFNARVEQGAIEPGKHRLWECNKQDFIRKILL